MARKNILISSRRRKAEALFRGNNLLDAKEAYTQLCKTDQLDPSNWTMLGVINRKLGLFQESEKCCRHALTIQHDHPAAHNALGAALQYQGKLVEAISCYRAAIRLQPDLFEAHYFLGNALREQGNFEDAIICYRRAIELKPDYLQALSNLGASLKQSGQFQESLRLLEKALRIRPDSVHVLCNIGEALTSVNQPEEAIKYFETAISIKHDFFDAHYMMGNALRSAGRFDDALASYGVALVLKPTEQSVTAGIAEILEIRRDIAAADRLIRPIVEAGSLNPRILAVYAALSHDSGTRATAASTLEKGVADRNVDIAGQIEIHYALGKIYDRMQEYNKAFEHYDHAKKKTRIFDREAFQKVDPAEQARQMVDWTETTRDHFWSSLPRATNCDERPIFVVGMPRSGTTLAEQILSSHPAVYGAGELTDISLIANTLRKTHCADTGYPECLAAASTDMLNKMAQRYLDHLDVLSRQASRIVDKMPGNFQQLGLISLLFPKARIIHIMRDPLDTCLSIYFQKFSTTNSYAFDLGTLGTYYQAYRKLMRYWRDKLTIPLLEIQYENLASAPEEWIRRMVEFCGLEWDVRCLDFHATRRDINTPSYDQVRQPMYTKSIGRWKHYISHLDPLMEALRK